MEAWWQTPPTNYVSVSIHLYVSPRCPRGGSYFSEVKPFSNERDDRDCPQLHKGRAPLKSTTITPGPHKWVWQRVSWQVHPDGSDCENRYLHFLSVAIRLNFRLGTCIPIKLWSSYWYPSDNLLPGWHYQTLNQLRVFSQVSNVLWRVSTLCFIVS